MIKGGLSFIITFLTVAKCLGGIQYYKTHHISCYLKNQNSSPITLIRSFHIDFKFMGLIVDPQTLHTHLIDMNNLDCQNPKVINSDSRYEKLIEIAALSPYPLENDGLTNDIHSHSVYLTVDLCPSHKEFNSDLKNFLISTSEILDRPLPVAFSISGGWIKEHAEELQELKQLQDQGHINITWVNHTRHHYYDKTIPNEHNFLLLENVNPLTEILDQEVLMLEHGITPSVFMRFPGLVSNERTIKLVQSLGLIPIGAKSWIAKTKSFKFGDIILIHGNGNESIGVTYFLNFISKMGINFPWQTLEQWKITE